MSLSIFTRIDNISFTIGSFAAAMLAREWSRENSRQVGRNLIILNPSWMIDPRRPHGRKKRLASGKVRQLARNAEEM
jgi:nucleoside-diphosphate-sugar epimerase